MSAQTDACLLYSSRAFNVCCCFFRLTLNAVLEVSFLWSVYVFCGCACMCENLAVFARLCVYLDVCLCI